MNWTTAYPTQPGFYWIYNYRYKHPTGSVLVPGATIVELDGDLDISFVGGEEQHEPDYIISAEWFGPILPPQENVS